MRRSPTSRTSTRCLKTSQSKMRVPDSESFMSRETMVSKGQQNPMLPGVALAPGAKEKKAYESARKKVADQYSKLSKMLAD